MLDRGDRTARPFGQRRPDDRAEPREEDLRGESPRSTGTLAWALRTAALAGFVAVVATQYLARLGGPGEAAIRVVQARNGVPADPETTGSIGRSAARPGAPDPNGAATMGGAARAIRLDPCALAAAGRPRP